MPTKLTVFISYASEDNVIAKEVSNVLQKAFGDNIVIYLDQFVFQKGAPLVDQIESYIHQADLLLVVSTGRTRLAHSWSGYELGAFQAEQRYKCGPENAPTPSANSLRGKVVCLCWSRDTAPDPLAGRILVPLGVPEDDLLLPEKSYEEKLKDRIRDGSDPFVRLLYQTSETIEGQDPKDDKGVIDRLYARDAEFKTLIRKHYLSRLNSVQKMERQIVVNYDINELASPGSGLGKTARYSLLGGAGSVFGLPDTQDQDKPWSEFTSGTKGNILSVFWIQTIRRLVNAASKNGPSKIDNVLLLGNDHKSVFRPVLTTVLRFNNGRQESSIYLIELNRRSGSGDLATTKLLDGIDAACRFRFLFLEVDSPFRALNAESKQNQGPDAAATFVDEMMYELNYLESDLTAAGLDEPGAWMPYVDEVNLRKMMVEWGSIRQRLVTAAESLLSRTTPEESVPTILLDLDKKLSHSNAKLICSLAEKLIAQCGGEGQ